MSLDQDLLAFNARVVRLLARCDARDKGARAVAYGSDFVLWLLSRGGKNEFAKLIHQVKKVKAGYGVARKIYRIGAPTKDVEAIVNSKETGVLHTLKVIMHVCNGMYYSIDTIELLTIFDILPYNTAKVKEFRYRFYCVKTVINILLTLIAIRRAAAALDKARQELDAASASGAGSAAAAAAVKEKQTAIRRLQATLIVALTDVPIAIFQVSDFGRKHIGPGGSGLSGLIGSLISFREIWIQSAK